MERQISFCTTSDGVHIAYVIWGQGPELVIPPGWVSHVEIGNEDPLVEAFGEKLGAHHTLVSYDKHGCGLSDRDRTDFSLEKELQYLETVIDHLKLQNLALFGFSQGGPIAISYAAKHPQRVSHLILYDTYARGDDITRDEIKESLISLVKAHWGLGSKTLADLFMPGASVDAVDAFTKFQRDASTAEVAARLLELIYQVDVTDLLPKITTPTVVMHRKGDRVMPFRLGRELAAIIPNVRFIPLEGKIHPPHLGDSDAVLRVIAEFLGDETVRTPETPAEKTVVRQGLKRKLTAILSADVKGYSRLMEDDEEATIRTLNTYREIISTIIQKHRGRVVDSTGDNLMSEFASVIDAVQCAVEVQKELKAKNAILAEERKMEFRIGVNLGDVVEEGDRIYGDGVNIAARIESLAEAGGICISGTVYDQIENKLSLEYDYQGEQSVKNISKPVHVYKIKMGTEGSSSTEKGEKKVHKIY